MNFLPNHALEWLLLLAVLLLALAGALRWDVLKLWLRGLVTPRQEPHLSLWQQPTERHRHIHPQPHRHPQDEPPRQSGG